jgi:DNA-binding MarR family transcriptional regulator
MSRSETVANPVARDDERLRPWRTFLTAHARVTRRLDEELRAEHGLSLAEYEALLQIAHAPDRRLRMSQLADRVLLSRSGVTRLIDRLVADGLVARTTCSQDARGAEAVLTVDGLGRLRQAAGTHLRGIDEYFLGTLGPADLETLERTLGMVAERASVQDDRPTPADAACVVAPEQADPAPGVIDPKLAGLLPGTAR